VGALNNRSSVPLVVTNSYMTPNIAQIASLKRMLKYRANGPTYVERLGLGALSLVLPALIGLLIGYVAVHLDVPGGFLLGAGIFIGATLMGLVTQKRFVDWWPFNREITDWHRVESLLGEGQEAIKTPRPAASIPWQKKRLIALVCLLAYTILLGLAFAGQRALAHIYDPRRDNPPYGVIVLSASWCGYCMHVREVLAANKFPYTDIDTEKTFEGRWAFEAVYGTGVPITIIGNQVVRGAKWNKLDTLLKAAGYKQFKLPADIADSSDTDAAAHDPAAAATSDQSTLTGAIGY